MWTEVCRGESSPNAFGQSENNRVSLTWRGSLISCAVDDVTLRKYGEMFDSLTANTGVNGTVTCLEWWQAFLNSVDKVAKIKGCWYWRLADFMLISVNTRLEICQYPSCSLTAAGNLRSTLNTHRLFSSVRDEQAETCWLSFSSWMQS